MAATVAGYGTPSMGWDTNNVLAYQQMYQQYMAQQGLVGYQVWCSILILTTVYNKSKNACVVK